MKEYRIAAYIRLSLADEDTGSAKSESDSIINQRSLINRFLDCNPALSGCSRTEFCDDGFTGTNTNRPAFTEMMAQVKQGKYDLICVKDFSRFSRDYIEIGDCLECLFPFLGVRFISINDAYDSDDYKGTTGGLDVVMRNIVYAAYSKDLSVKTTTAKIQMMKQGKFVGSYAPYGYILHPAIRNKLAIDPEAAQIVRRIFDMAIAGSGATAIAKQLNAEGIPTPGQYFISKNSGTGKYRHTSDKLNWSYPAVHGILTKLTYTGATVGHVSKTVVPLSKKVKKQNQEDWIVVEGMHEAIVTRAEFDAAQEVINKQKRRSADVQNKSMYPLRSLVRCGNCGRAMTYDKRRKGFYCPYGKTAPERQCPAGIVYGEDELEEILFNAITAIVQAAVNDKPSSKELRHRKRNTIQEKLDLLSALQAQSEKLKKLKLKLYEQYTADEISRQSYLEQKKTIDEKAASTAEEIALLETEVAELEATDTHHETAFEQSCNTFFGETALSYESAHAFVKAVYVFPDKRVEIRWKFRDVFDEIQPI